jgi:broad specificity phosphatase PhoE
MGRNEDAANAKARLLSREVGNGALLLSSNYPRALQTAEVIAKGIGSEVIPSKRLAEGGNYPKGIESLDDFLLKALEEAGVEQAGRALVVVTHAPMLTIALQRYEDDAIDSIGYGMVVDYVPGSWRNPQFTEHNEFVLDLRIKS